MPEQYPNLRILALEQQLAEEQAAHRNTKMTLQSKLEDVEMDEQHWRESCAHLQSKLDDANGTIKQLHKDIAFVDADCANTKAAHVAAVDELVEVRGDLAKTERFLSHALGTLAHLEHGIKEHRRVEQNIATEVLITRVRKEMA